MAGALAGFLVWPPQGALLGIAGTALLVGFQRRRRRRRADLRREALAAPFPQAWRDFLLGRYDHFERLPEDQRRRFEDDVRLFLIEKKITGVGVEATDELRLLVAASAVTLALGWPDYEWYQLTEVLLYPQEFDRDYGFESARPDEFDEEGHLQASVLAGQATPWGTVVLSAPSLLESFEDPDDAFHVGLHEFAHLLDADRNRFGGGIPAGLDEARARAWAEVAARERARLVHEEGQREAPPKAKGRRRRAPRQESVFDPYGAQDATEFLAVAVEAFFEASLAVRREHPEAYALLAEYFGQDPAAWDDARGLRLE